MYIIRQTAFFIILYTRLKSNMGSASHKQSDRRSKWANKKQLKKDRKKG